MKPYDFAEHLADWGPGSTRPVPTLDESLAYTDSLARSHYENFAVLSWAVPRHLRPHVANVYAFSRWSDDLGDEVGSPARANELLDWWEDLLRELARGNARHPVMIALRGTIDEYSIPIDLFLDLISAFRQDQVKERYETVAELCDYCTRSANPVGRIVLYLLRQATSERMAWSDAVCTGLQWTNFLQDVAVDLFEKGRVYLPREVQDSFGVTTESLRTRQSTHGFQEMMREETKRARRWLNQGKPLAQSLSGRSRLMVALFSEGGKRMLRRIEAARYNVLKERPRLSSWDRGMALMSAIRIAYLPTDFYSAKEG